MTSKLYTSPAVQRVIQSLQAMVSPGSLPFMFWAGPKTGALATGISRMKCKGTCHMHLVSVPETKLTWHHTGWCLCMHGRQNRSLIYPARQGAQACSFGKAKPVPHTLSSRE